MKEKGTTRKVNITVAFMCICIVVVMGLFSALTLTIIKQNVELQTQMATDTIMKNIEDELFSFDEVCYILSRNFNIYDMVAKGEGDAFYDYGATTVNRIGGFLVTLKNTDSIVVFDKTGRFYRLKGNVSNTVLKRSFYLAENGSNRTLNVLSGNESYIGLYEKVERGGEVLGYVVALSEQSLIKSILGEYDELDYIEACLFSGDELVCSSRSNNYDQVKDGINHALYIKETEIGLSGFRLLVYCDNTLIKNFMAYFAFAFPSTIGLLILLYVVNLKIFRKNVETRYALDMERTHLALLKKQISAHFTVNTLNVIRALVNKGERDTAAKTCDELSQLLRYANGGDEFISLMEEFGVIEQYILIMQTRYPGKIELEIDEKDFFSEIFIPKMLLQPIVENAVVHGISGRKGKITIKAETEGNKLLIRVKDDGKGIEADAYNEVMESLKSVDSDYQKIESIALGNIQKRIRVICGEEYGLTITSEPGEGTEVLVSLPLDIREEEEELEL